VKVTPQGHHKCSDVLRAKTKASTLKAKAWTFEAKVKAVDPKPSIRPEQTLR